MLVTRKIFIFRIRKKPLKFLGGNEKRRFGKVDTHRTYCRQVGHGETTINVPNELV